jgi:hypothetical protein
MEVQENFTSIRLPLAHCADGRFSFVDEETNGSYPFANVFNELNRINGLTHLWLLVSWMERALSGDEPLIVLKTICCFSVFNFEFSFFGGIAQRLPLFMLLGQPSCKCVRGCWQPSGKFVTGGQRVMATLW